MPSMYIFLALNKSLCKNTFYCTTTAYHVGLSAVSGGCRQLGQAKINKDIIIELSYQSQHMLSQGTQLLL